MLLEHFYHKRRKHTCSIDNPAIPPYTATYPSVCLLSFILFKGEVHMKKLLLFTGTFALLVGLLAGFLLAAMRSDPIAHASDAKKVHVIEHALTDTEQDWKTGSMSLGDILA